MKRIQQRRGAAAVLAMMFLVLMTTLTVAMYSTASLNSRSASNLADAAQARDNAESGLRWMAYRFLKMSRPKTTVGLIDSTVASTIWPSLATSIKNDMATLLTSSETPVVISGSIVTTSSIKTGSGSFAITVSKHPLYTGDTLDSRYLRVSSTGAYGEATRTVYMDFKMDKKIRFAVVGKVPIQLGRNVMVEGSVAMGSTLQPSGQPPLLSVSDFRNLNSSLQSKVDAFQTFLKNNYSGYDNRISVNAGAAYTAAVNAGYSDKNSDGYIDEYDLFIKEFDKNNNKAVTASEFTNSSTGKLYDDNLMTIIDMLGGPLYSGDTIRTGYQDGIVDNRDSYAKVKGQVIVAESADSLLTRLAAAGKSMQDVLQGPIVPLSPGDQPVKFSATQSDIFDLSPSNFDTTGFANKSGTAAGTSSKSLVAPNVGSSTMTNCVVTGADANGYMDSSNHVVKTLSGDQTPYGSSSIQATYNRPVFTNVTFTNCKISKGTNALFTNCTFKGVTFVDMTTNITNSSGQTTTNKDDGMTWAKRMKSGSFSTTTALTATNSYGFTDGNNLRFNDCTFNGPLASTVPTAYTHFSNSWEFTGKTMFNNNTDQTATIIAPQVNIEMGSFTDPTQAPSTLVGVVVAGNIDIRGTGIVDGSIIVTGDGAGNTTLGYFGASDDDTNPTAMPQGGYGRLLLRYNPYRALPDGINVSIDVLPDVSTYQEVAP